MQRPLNPYVSRGPVRLPEMFFGRTDQLTEIAAFMRGNQSISIVGPRKIGKTSLLFHLMRPAVRESLGLGPEYLMAYLDCEVLGESPTDEIFGLFAAELSASLESAGQPPEPTLDRVQEKPTRLAFESAVRKLNQRGIRVVLILDEFERLSVNPNLDVNFFNALRSAAGRYQLIFITASARALIDLTYAERSENILSSPFFNIFAPLFLGLLPDSEAAALIMGPSAAAGVPFPAEMGEFIYDLVGGHPLALQVACFHAFDSPNQPDQVEEATLRELNAHFQYYWRNLSPIEQDTLRRLGEAATHASTDTTLRTVLRDLVQKSLLVAENGTYRYPSRAWHDYVLAQNTPPPVVSRTGAMMPLGAQIGPYEILNLLGRGGMAEVYLARHTRLERTVALKVLSPNLATDEDFRRRFEREARAIAALKHPNIVGVFDFGEHDSAYYMVMEYISGQTLAALLRGRGALPLESALLLLSDLAGALDYAHSRGVVHRDVKPSNIMLDPVTVNASNPLGYRAVLTDFGIAKMARNKSDGTMTNGITGTPDYMPPEQIRAETNIDGRADLYSVGIVAYQMLTGRLPFETDSPAAAIMAHLTHPAPDPRQFAPELPESAAAGVLRALAKEPDQRFPTVGAFLAALRDE